MPDDNPIVPRKVGELTKVGSKGNPILDTMVKDALQLAKESSELSEDAEVQFKCKNLEKAVRDALEMPEGTIRRRDMLRLEKLQYGGWDKKSEPVLELDQQVTDLSGLEHAQNLRRLELTYNQIEDIEPLRDMTQLEYLYLYYNQIEDIEPLKDMTRLEILALLHNQIEDISPLRNLTQLEVLSLLHNQIEDIEPLRKLTQLWDLNLGENKIVDIEPLRKLTQLERLVLWRNQIKDITPLKDLTQLKELDLDQNPLTKEQIANLQKALPKCNIRFLHARR